MENVAHKSKFTLIELIVAMGVFAVLMAALMQFFSSAQKLWTSTSSKTEQFEDARVVMNMIAVDLQNAYYEYGHDSKKLFICPMTGDFTGFGVSSVRTSPPNEFCRSNLCNVLYKLDTTGHILKINVVGESVSGAYSLNSNWLFMKDTTAFSPVSTDNPFDHRDDSNYAISSPASNLDGWKELIPYVIDFTYKFYAKDGTELPATKAGFASTANKDRFPYRAFFSITLSDRANYQKWQQAGAPASGTVYDNLIGNNARTFSRVVLLDRNQYP